MRPAPVMWFTGLPSSGKSTLARAVHRALRKKRVPCVLLDSDEVRAALFPELTYTAADRRRFYMELSELAALLSRQGLVALVAATANLRSYRAHARASAHRFIEVYVDTPLSVCAARDTKGLYRSQARALPGGGATYQPPLRPHIRAKGGSSPAAVDACVRALCVTRNAKRRTRLAQALRATEPRVHLLRHRTRP